jgi:hypothetical protein
MSISRQLSRLTILAVFLMLLGEGCGVSRNQAVATEDDRDDVREAALDCMQHLIDGNAEGFLSYMAENFVDLGGGSSGDGSVDINRRRAELERKFARESFRSKFGNLVLSDVLQIDSLAVYGYEEIMVDEWLKREKFGYTVQPGDLLVTIPRTPDSPLPDGFMAYFRKIAGSWKIIAGD